MEVDEIAEIEEKSSELVTELRFKRRDELSKSRGLHRQSAFDKNRFLESEILKEEDIKGLCGRIKRRKHCTEEDLEKLGNAFFQSEANISSFIKVTGAINVIIKEFIGLERQLHAAKVICNMSLGDEICCSKIALFAGAYLMIFLKNVSNVSLIKLCIWTVENLISSGTKALQILMSQELLSNTLNLIKHMPDQEIKHEAIQTLDIIIDKAWNELDMEAKHKVWECLNSYLEKNACDVIALQSIFRISCVEDFSITKSILNVITENVTKTDERIIAVCLQILSNLFQRDVQYLSYFLDYFVRNNVKLSQIINRTFTLPKHYSTSRQFLTFVASIMTMESSIVQNYLQYDDILGNLKIPRMFEF